MKIQKILCPVDKSTSAKYALKFAREFARNHDSVLDLIHVFSSEPKMQDSYKSVNQKELEEELGVDPGEILYKEGSIPKVIVEAGNDYDMIIMGLRGDHHSTRYYGSNAAQIIQNATCPVFLIPKKEINTHYRKIVFATDFQGLEQEEAVEVLRDFANDQDSDLHLLHISRSADLDGDEREEALELHHIFEDINHAFFVVEEKDIIKGINKHLKEHQPEVLAIMPKHTTGLADTLSQAIIDNMDSVAIFSFHS